MSCNYEKIQKMKEIRKNGRDAYGFPNEGEWVRTDCGGHPAKETRREEDPQTTPEPYDPFSTY